MRIANERAAQSEYSSAGCEKQQIQPILLTHPQPSTLTSQGTKSALR
ncbi:hypothetical protein [Acinetobacter tianfuensis]|nr:hypothetical protein [Acinetobacter tianfuensis]